MLADDEHSDADQRQKIGLEPGPKTVRGPWLLTWSLLALVSPQAGSRQWNLVIGVRPVMYKNTDVRPGYMHHEEGQLWGSKLVSSILTDSEDWVGCQCGFWAPVGAVGRKQEGPYVTGTSGHKYLCCKCW